MSALLADAAAAALSARRTYDTLCALCALRQDKLQPVAATVAGVHDDAVALRFQVESAYELMCKVMSALIILQNYETKTD
jgi:hypothetical protein